MAMRDEFHGELRQLGEQLTAMCTIATEAMRQATRAVLEADVELANHVLRSDAALDHRRSVCEEHALRLLTLQSPVAGDLRTVLAVLYCGVKIERMGDLTVHIAESVRYAAPEPPVPAELRDSIATLGDRTVSMAERVGALIIDAVAEDVADLERTDDDVDALCSRIRETITGTDWPHGVAPALRLTLLARFYERFADQAVSVARRLAFATTGTLPDLSPQGPRKDLG